MVGEPQKFVRGSPSDVAVIQEDSSKDMTYECRHCNNYVANLSKHYAFDCEILHPVKTSKDITSVVERDSEGRINLDSNKE